MKVTGGRAVVDALSAWGVEVVFGIPGVRVTSCAALKDAIEAAFRPGCAAISIDGKLVLDAADGEMASGALRGLS